MKIKKRLKEFFIQIIPVMVGVYLGFLVSDWSSNRQVAQKKEALLESLKAEIMENQSMIASVLEYHEQLRDTAALYANKGVTRMPSFFGGVRTIPLTSSAFETGIQTGLINELSIQEIQNLNRLYTHQQSYNDFSNLLLSGLMNIGYAPNEQSMRQIMQFLAISMTDVAIKEEKLLEEYELILSTHFKE
ncbi:hypothetical protein [Penaeicola halotolerans]|uniref:hypothetical protein n=1 Tax=Penaeicola halotolerans TaxID=2793196 RepID=UPI001CF8E3DE|nr:hypothetical protein [Penaeicola halotolerans]